MKCSECGKKLESNLKSVIRTYRAMKNINQHEMAAALGMNRVILSRIENGHSDLSIAQAKKMADLLGVDLLELTDLACP